MLTTQRHDRRVRRQAGLLLESLDDRLLLSGGARGATAEALVHHQPANHRAVTTISACARFSGTDRPLRCRATFLQHSDRSTASTRTKSAIAAPRQASPPTGCSPSAASESPCESRWRSPPPWVRTCVELRADGLQVIRTMPAYGMAEGTLPIAKLPAVAQLAAHVWPASLPIKA